MLYIVTIKQGGDEVSFKFTDSIRANMFAEMAAKSIEQKEYYSTYTIKEVSIVIELVMDAEEPATSSEEKEAE